MLNLIIGGDICPTKRDETIFSSSQEAILFGDISEKLKNADYCIANLETPLITQNTPIPKSGAVFGAKPEILNVLKSANISFLNLSNNHILDHGKIGLQTTIDAIIEREFDYGGAGNNLELASKIFTKTINSITFSIISYCEHEFSVATKNRCGANPLDVVDFISKIKKVREISDFIILLYHGGKENYNLPSPNQLKLCRMFIDEGVNMVCCQHSHSIGLIENYKEGVIFYGQGNFVFDPYPLKKDWLYKGFLVDVKIKGKSQFQFDLIPYMHRSFEGDNIGIRMLNENEKKEFQENILNLTREFNENPEIIEIRWKELANKLSNTYLSVLRGNGRLSRKVNEKTSFLNLIYRDHRRLTLKNIVTCETHRELLEAILTS